MWIATNACSFLVLLFSGWCLGNGFFAEALTFGAPAGLVFGLTFKRGFPLGGTKK
jgi:hypothetical protein